MKEVICRNIDYDLLFPSFWLAMYSILFRNLEITNDKRGTQLFRKLFLLRSRATTRKYLYTLSHFEIAFLIRTIPFAICQANENSC